MDPFEFEKAVSRNLESKGYHTKVTNSTGDGGVDVVAREGETKIAVQCKFYSSGNSVSSPEVQQVSGLLADPDYDHAVLVTTSDFTDEAEVIARQRNVQLIKANIEVSMPEIDDKGVDDGNRTGIPNHGNLNKREEEINAKIDQHLNRVENGKREYARVEFDEGRYLIHGTKHEVKHESTTEIAKIIRTARNYGWEYVSTVNKEGQTQYPHVEPRIAIRIGDEKLIRSEKPTKVLSLVCKKVFNTKIQVEDLDVSKQRPADAFKTRQITDKKNTE